MGRRPTHLAIELADLLQEVVYLAPEGIVEKYVGVILAEAPLLLGAHMCVGIYGRALRKDYIKSEFAALRVHLRLPMLCLSL